MWPRWTSNPVGSMPSLTRSGRPVASFLRSSSSGVILSTPRRIRASWSSTDFIARLRTRLATLRRSVFGTLLRSVAKQSGSVIHLEPPDRLERARVMDDVRLAVVRRPADGDHVEPGRVVEQAVLRQVGQGRVGELALLGEVHGRGRPFDVAALRGPHFDEHERPAVEGDQVEFAGGQVDVAGEDAVAEL